MVDAPLQSRTSARIAEPSKRNPTRRVGYQLVGGELPLSDVPAGVDVVLVPRSRRAEARVKDLVGARRLRRWGLVDESVSVVGVAKPLATDAYALGPKAQALLKGRELAEADLREAGGAFDLQQVSDLLRISRQAVDKKVKDDGLLAVAGPNGQRRYPAVQFTADGVSEGLKAVLKALPSRSGWFRLNFLISTHPALGYRRPIDLLSQGDVGSVVKAAERTGEQGG